MVATSAIDTDIVLFGGSWKHAHIFHLLTKLLSRQIKYVLKIKNYKAADIKKVDI